jgi:hypothetical protein
MVATNLVFGMLSLSILVPLLAARMIPAVSGAFAMPDPPAAGAVGSALENLIALPIGPFIIDPPTIGADLFEDCGGADDRQLRHGHRRRRCQDANY